MPSLGDMAALAQVFEEPRAKLLAMLGRRIDPAVAGRFGAEDVLGDAFLEAQRRWPRHPDQPGPPDYVWLYGIARDCLIAAWRRHARGCRSPRREVPWPEASSVQLGLGLIRPPTGPGT